MDKANSELVQKILFMIDIEGKSYRTVGKELGLSKDSVMRRYQKAKNQGIEAQIVKSKDLPEVPLDEELIQLKIVEREAKKRIVLAREKLETLERIKDLVVTEVSISYQVRREIFSDSNKILEFAEKVMPIRNPKLWIDFKEYCEVKKWDVRDALIKALSSQEDYEELQKDFDEAGELYSLDIYFEDWIETSMKDWKMEDQQALISLYW